MLIPALPLVLAYIGSRGAGTHHEFRLYNELWSRLRGR